MCREVVYWTIELFNYWSMMFWGCKLIIENDDNKKLRKNYNLILGSICIPISVIATSNYKYAPYSNVVSYFLIVCMLLIVKIFFRDTYCNILHVAIYVFSVRLIDLWIVAVMTEVNKFSRDIYVELIKMGMHRCVFLIILIICYYYVYKICKKTLVVKYLISNKLYCYIFCVYSFIGNICFCTVYRFDYREKLINYWIFYLVCAFILLGTILFYLVMVKGKEKERLLNMRNNMMEANYQGLQKAYDANRMLQHDNKNHMLAMYELIKDNRNEEVLNYINKWMNMSKNSLASIRSGNEIIDIIVNSKVNEAKEKNIVFEYDVAHVGNLRIEDVDMCALLANLMDNAIEACEKIETNSWIHLSISRKNDMLLILIKNSISEEMLKKKSFFETEKEKPHLHGWGMKSIEHVIHKYDGEIVKTQKEDRLEIFITLPA